MNPRRRRVRVALAALLVGATGCGEALADDAVVRLRNELRFDPAVVEVPVGATVTWQNDGARTHTVTEIDDSGRPAADGFDSDEIIGTGSFGHTFSEAGTFAYRCQIHADEEMVGVVVVTP